MAVRSSATAEDLPDLSFAGQQDTYLNVIGENALLKAVVRCWGSLWTARAIGYRARNGIGQNDVALAVVVQAMIPSEAAGVLFTVNPLSGKRTEIVIDATLGLGEALVSGKVEPDHYVVVGWKNQRKAPGGQGAFDPRAGRRRHANRGPSRPQSDRPCRTRLSLNWPGWGSKPRSISAVHRTWNGAGRKAACGWFSRAR